MKLVEGRGPCKTEKYTNEEAVGFKLEAESTVWDSPRRSKVKFHFCKQKVITCAAWVLRQRWYIKNNRKRDYKPKYTTHQYYDFIAYFLTLVVIRVLKQDGVIFDFPYRLGKLKTIKFKSTWMDERGRIYLNLHSFRMTYRFLWSFGTIPTSSLYKFVKCSQIKKALEYSLRGKEATIWDSFFFFIKSPKRTGAWVNAPDRDLDKLYEILTKHYGPNIYKPDHQRLAGRRRLKPRKYFKKSVKKVGY